MVIYYIIVFLKVKYKKLTNYIGTFTVKLMFQSIIFYYNYYQIKKKKNRMNI